jgi:hypothetical protein
MDCARCSLAMWLIASTCVPVCSPNPSRLTAGETTPPSATPSDCSCDCVDGNPHLRETREDRHAAKDFPTQVNHLDHTQ